MQRRTILLSTGSYVPDLLIANEDLKQFPPAVINLITKKTGIKARRFAHDSQCTSDLALCAAERCLSKINFDPGGLDGIILATSSPDRVHPPTATRLQHNLGAGKAFAFDLNAVCSGGVFALSMADSLIRSFFCENVLVVASEIYSKFLDATDFSTYPFFGDGAGAVLLSAGTDANRGIIHSILRNDGSKADIIQVPAGGTMLPYSKNENPKDLYFKMIGREVYNFAVTQGTEIIRQIIAEAGVRKEDIKFIIAHQANINIIREISTNLDIDFHKFPTSLEKYGNTAGASVLITLDELLGSNQANSSDLLLLVAFGGGLSWGANLIRI
jgi:3-oxoacyl-[acyl-carrier-protein] synthase-3